MENEQTMISLTDIAKNQNNIFLSDTMTGNLQLIRLEHIGYFQYYCFLLSTKVNPYR